MRLKKVDVTLTKETLPAIVIARILLDLRALCSELKQDRIYNHVSKQIYNYLKERGCTHVFQPHSFDNNLLEDCIRTVNFGTLRPAYIEFNPYNTLELLQAQILKKFGIPCYPENPIYEELKLINEVEKMLGGENNEWE